MRARKLLLLVVILCCGAGIEVAHGVRDDLSIGPTGCRVLSGRFYGPSFEFDTEERSELAPGTAVLVENAFGAVVVSGTGGSELSARLRTRVYAPGREQARAFSEQVRLDVGMLDGRLRVATNRDALGGESRRTPGFETDLELVVPAGTALEVRSHHARVELQDLGSAVVAASYEPVTVARVSGSVDLKARHGKLHVESIGGELDLQSSHGDVSIGDVAGAARLDVRHGAVRARGIAGLTLRHHYGQLDASEIAGDLELHGVHAGVRAREVSGKARVETSYADVRLSGVRGELRSVTLHGGLRVDSAGSALSAEVSDGRVRLDAVNGPLALTTRRSDVRVFGLREGGRIESDGNDVELRDFSGALEVRVRLGDIRLFPGGPLEHSLDAVSRDGGSITLALDPGSGFRLDAEAPHGEVRDDLADFEVTRRERGKLTGGVGQASTPVSLRAERGDVVVRESGSR
jgi:DUF4097 and DUF4098 domain-containing protein YvlB